MRAPAGKPGAGKRPFRPDTILTFRPTESAGLFEFLMRSMPERKRTNVKELLRHSQVAVNGVPVTRHDAPVTPSDEVKVNLTREFKVFHHRRLRIVYEDADIIVVHKGYGLLSMGTGAAGEETAYSILRDYVKWHDPRNKIFIVHRLDRDTSGLMVFARTEEAKTTLQHNWNAMVIERKYVAVVEGVPDPPADTVKSYLAENKQFEVYSTTDPELGKLAVTNYTTLRASRRYALLEVQLATGRKNQIRVHMKDIGHPISGDRKYGAAPNSIHRLALHARSLKFMHPSTREVMDFTTPVPASLLSLLK